jgi:2-C-methyl-D-erythritol 4-phosphate cytidylyltransferase
MDGIVLTAAGASTRLGGPVPKVLRHLRGTPILLRALAAFRIVMPDAAVVVTARPSDVKTIRDLVRSAAVVPGGATRQASVLEGVKALPWDVESILVHDAARPLLPVDVVQRVLDAVRRDGAAVAVVPVPDTLHRLEPRAAEHPDRIAQVVDRKGLVAAQTPQGARADLMRKVLLAAAREGREATDEAALLTAAGVPVTAVLGDVVNFKITTADDLELAERILDGRAGVVTRA